MSPLRTRIVDEETLAMSPLRALRRVLGALILGASLAACVSEPSYEGRSCVSDDDCPNGLVCLSEVCRRPGSKPAPDGGVLLPPDAADGSIIGPDANGLPHTAPDGSVADGSVTDGSVPAPPDAGALDVVTAGNPFRGARLQLDLGYAAAVSESTALVPAAQAAALERLKTVPTAVWLSGISDLSYVEGHLEAALAEQNRTGQVTLSAIVVYNLPSFACGTLATPQAGDRTRDGAARYTTDFIDRFAAVLARHANQRIALFLEPAGIAHVATTYSTVPTCAVEAQALRTLLAHAIRQLAQPHVSIYLDIGHSGWLGWEDAMSRGISAVSTVLTAAGGAGKLRGFVTNVGNYNPLRKGLERFDYGANPAHDELTFIQRFQAALDAAGILGKTYVIDTSRNGRTGIRADWSAWCNLAGAGLGPRATVDPQPTVDAYYWVKAPGFSDGATDPAQPTYHVNCVSPDSAPNAPPSGRWFHAYVLSLVRNAVPAL